MQSFWDVSKDVLLLLDVFEDVEYRGFREGFSELGLFPFVVVPGCFCVHSGPHDCSRDCLSQCPVQWSLWSFVEVLSVEEVEVPELSVTVEPWDRSVTVFPFTCSWTFTRITGPFPEAPSVTSFHSPSTTPSALQPPELTGITGLDTRLASLGLVFTKSLCSLFSDRASFWFS